MSDNDIAKSEGDTSHSIEAIVFRQTTAGIVIKYYWLPILLSMLLYIYLYIFHREEQQNLIEISFYPMYILAGGGIKFFLQKRVPATFSRLRETGALGEGAAQQLTKDFASRLDHPLGTILGVGCGLSILLWYSQQSGWSNLVRMNLDFTIAWIAIVAIDVLLAYAAGIAIWKAGITAHEFQRLGQRGVLKIRPFFPDGCAGLAAIGQLFLTLSVILIAIGLYLSGWLLYGYVYGYGISERQFQAFAPIFSRSLIGIILVSIGIFFWPLLGVHRFMKEEATIYEVQGLALARRIADLEEALLASGAGSDDEELKARLARIESLRSTYLHQRIIPTWPVDFVTLGKFLGAQVMLWISTATAGLDLWSKGKGVVS
jgi:hypothetical protein